MISDIFSSFDPTINSAISILPSLILTISLFSCLQKYWLFPSSFIYTYQASINLINDQSSRTLGNKISGFRRLITFLFPFLITINLIGLFPYVIRLSRHLIFTLSLGMPIWLSLIFSSFLFNTKQASARLLPGGAPDWLNPFLVLVETIRVMARPLTLSFRLAANITAGHVVLGLLGSYVRFSLCSSPMALSSWLSLITQAGYIGFELGICLIQAYIFCLLLTLYSDEHSS